MSRMLDEYRERWALVKSNIIIFKRENKEVSQRKIAEMFGVSLGYVNKCLKNLQV